jgi:transcriptional regulator with GAF, ATPase, and Fis domain
MAERLNAAVANGIFRQDLFYRPNVFPIAVPPLWERSIDKKTLNVLLSYNWPGNIREL